MRKVHTVKRMSKIAAILLILGHSGSVYAGAEAEPAPYGGVPICATEDSDGPCLWDARVNGNRRGTSFWVDRNGGVWPINERIMRVLRSK